MLTPADLLVRGLGLESLATPPEMLPSGTRSAISGALIEHGYPVSFVTTGAMSGVLDEFGDLSGYVSEAEAILFKNASPRLGNIPSRSVLVFEDGTYYWPLISRVSAREKGRPCWSDLVRQLWPVREGQRMLMILSTDTKKRLWTRARTGILGSTTLAYVYDPSGLGIADNVALDWWALVNCLGDIEAAYNAGFYKQAIREGLFSAYRVVERHGFGETKQLEDMLIQWRGKPEFDVAWLIAQKNEEDPDVGETDS